MVCGLWFGVWGLGLRVWGLGCGVWGLGFGVWGLGFGVWDLGFGVSSLGFRVQAHEVSVRVDLELRGCGLDGDVGALDGHGTGRADRRVLGRVDHEVHHACRNT